MAVDNLSNDDSICLVNAVSEGEFLLLVHIIIGIGSSFGSKFLSTLDERNVNPLANHYPGSTWQEPFFLFCSHFGG